jgi:hypothetical protein
MLSKLAARVRAAVVTSLGVLTLGLGMAAPAVYAQQAPCEFGSLYPHAAHGTKVNVKLNGHPKTITCNNGKWTIFVKPPRPVTPSQPPALPPRSR